MTLPQARALDHAPRRKRGRAPPQLDVLAIVSGLVIITGVIVTVATRPRLGLPSSARRGELSPAP